MKHAICYLSFLAFTGLFFFTGCQKDEKAPEPQASFTCKTIAEVGEVITFSNQSLNAKSYVWDFDDGTTSTSENPTHAFSEAGNYTVELTAEGDGGTNSTTNVISVEEPEPVAKFQCKTSALVGEEIIFTNNSDNASTYAWDFGDGGSSTDANPTHVYNDAGTFTVTLTATGAGGENSKSVNITITHPAPVANFTISSNPAPVGLEITFTNTSEHATSYSWNFGDGGTSTTFSPKHTYAAAGTFTVTLTATGPGGVNSNSQDITITEPAPGGSLTGYWTGDMIMFQTIWPIVFSIQQSGNVLSGYFEFGDASGHSPLSSTSNISGQNVTIDFTVPGYDMTFKFTGVVNNAFDEMSGNVSLKSTSSTAYGTWSASKSGKKSTNGGERGLHDLIKHFQQ